MTPSRTIKHNSKNIRNQLETWTTYHRTRFHSTLRTSLYIFKDNETVIKQINYGRILTMRHVPHTHRVHQSTSDDSDQILQHNRAIGRHSHRRLIHRRQMDTPDTTGQLCDHIHSSEFVGFFCGCDSFIFQHE